MPHRVTIERFDGGLNTKVSPFIADPSESPDCQNVIFDDFGAVETRLGREQFISNIIYSGPIRLLHSYIQATGTAHLVMVNAGQLYLFTSNVAGLVSSSQSEFSEHVRVQAANFQNQLWLSNGYSVPRKYNGTEFTQWGIPVPSACVASYNSGAGSLESGFYKYVIAGVNSNLVNGTYGSECTEISTIANDSIDLSDIPVYPVSAGVNNKLICRNTANASGVYYVVTEISNAQTSYTDTHADSDLVTSADADNGVPPYFTCMKVHNRRIFGAAKYSSDPTRLWYSDIDTPEVFQSTSFLRIGEKDGYLIEDIQILSNGILIGKNDGKGNGSTYLLYMPDTTPANWTLIRLDTVSGAQVVNTMVRFSNFIAFLTQNGIFDISEFEVGNIKSDPLSFNIQPDIYNIDLDYFENSYSINYKNKVWFALPSTDVSIAAHEDQVNTVYQYDYIRGRDYKERNLGSWARFSNMLVTNFCIHEGQLYAAGNDNGIVYKMDTGYNDDGSAIESYYKTMAIVGRKNHENNVKVWRYAYITVKAVGDWSLSVQILKDTSVTGPVVTVSLDPGGALFGSAIHDTDEWGSPLERKRMRVNFTEIVSKSIQLLFKTNEINQYFVLEKIEVYYNLRGTRGSDVST